MASRYASPADANAPGQGGARLLVLLSVLSFVPLLGIVVISCAIYALAQPGRTRTTRTLLTVSLVVAICWTVLWCYLATHLI
jgi:uncharacterized BrkB/YihY/UPF0761 family membrane protein